VIRHEVRELREPEVRDGIEHAALVGNRIGQHHIERRQPVGGHDEKRRGVDGVDVAHLAFVQALEALEVGAVNDGRWHALGTIR